MLAIGGLSNSVHEYVWFSVSNAPLPNFEDHGNGVALQPPGIVERGVVRICWVGSNLLEAV